MTDFLTPFQRGIVERNRENHIGPDIWIFVRSIYIIVEIAGIIEKRDYEFALNQIGHFSVFRSSFLIVYQFGYFLSKF